jgi:dephospho-CoA kinase
MVTLDSGTTLLDVAQLPCLISPIPYRVYPEAEMSETTKNIFKIAVTGGAGSGKTSVCNRFKKFGVTVISSDATAREAVAKGSLAYDKIVHRFGKKMLLKNGQLDRQMLRSTIVKDNNARLDLEKIIHPEITKLMRQKMAQAERDGNDCIFAEVPLLFELGLEKHFDVVIVISADHNLRVKRLVERDGITHDEAENLIKVQMPEEEKVERTEFVIINEGSKEELTKSIELLYKENIKKLHKKIETP